MRLGVRLPHNSKVVDVQGNGSGSPHVDRPGNGAPRPVPGPVPELPVDEAPPSPAATPRRPQPSEAVTDEDRNRFGALLDHAAERGLLGPNEYQVRLRELAEATSIGEMTTIVSELPAFTAAPDAARAKAIPGEPGLGSWQPRVQRRSPPWVLLIIVIVTVALALVILAIYAGHAVHVHSGGAPRVPVILSSPRL